MTQTKKTILDVVNKESLASISTILGRDSATLSFFFKINELFDAGQFYTVSSLYNFRFYWKSRPFVIDAEWYKLFGLIIRSALNLNYNTACGYDRLATILIKLKQEIKSGNLGKYRQFWFWVRDCQWGSKWTELSDIIAKAPEAVLGKKVTERFGPTFPLLIKFIDAKTPIGSSPSQRRIAQQRHDSFGKWNVVGFASRSRGRTDCGISKMDRQAMKMR